MLSIVEQASNRFRHPKCKGHYDEINGNYGCEYDTVLDCGECKYGAGKKDPDAKCNRPS